MPSDANRIIHDDEAEAKAHGEQRVAHSMAKRHRSRERGAKRRVGRRHSPGAEQHPEVPPPLHKEVEEHLYGLRQGPGHEPRHEGRVSGQRPQEGADPGLGHRRGGAHQQRPDAAAAKVAVLPLATIEAAVQPRSHLWQPGEDEPAEGVEDGEEEAERVEARGAGDRSGGEGGG